MMSAEGCSRELLGSWTLDWMHLQAYPGPKDRVSTFKKNEGRSAYVP